RGVRHVDFDDRRAPVFRRVLFEIDRSRHPDGDGADRGHDHDQRRADPRSQDAGALGAPRSEVREEIPGEALGTVADEVDEQHRQNREANEHHEQADDDEDLIEHFAPRQPVANELRVEKRRDGWVVAHQYASRKRRVREKPMTLKTSVMIMSTRPAAKMLWYPTLPCGRSPRLT